MATVAATAVPATVYPQQPPPRTRPQPAYQPPPSSIHVPPPPTQQPPSPYQQPQPYQRPRSPYSQPGPAIMPYQPQPNGIPQPWPTQIPPQRKKHTGLKLFALIGFVVIAAVIAISVGKHAQPGGGGTSADQGQYMPGSPAAVVHNDSYSLLNSGSTTLENGITVNWAEGSNASNVGILVVQTDNTADASTEAAELQSTSTAVTVTQDGDTVTLLDPNGAGDISSWLRNNGWTN
jgi:hypothetical protein